MALASRWVWARRRPWDADGLVGSSALGGTGHVAALVTDPVEKCKVEHVERDEAYLSLFGMSSTRGRC